MSCRLPHLVSGEDEDLPLQTSVDLTQTCHVIQKKEFSYNSVYNVRIYTIEGVFTVRKRSLGKGNVFTHVCLSTGGGVFV